LMCDAVAGAVMVATVMMVTPLVASVYRSKISVSPGMARDTQT